MRKGAEKNDQGVLYVVSTPIGNLEDITLRALKVLNKVDVVAAEKVTHTKKLFEYHGIRTRLTSYNQHNRGAKAPQLINRLKSGQDVALVSNAGTPGVSDPGSYLIHRAGREGIKLVPIPGPSAVLAGICVSGFPGDQFVFLGFLPGKAGKRRNELHKLSSESRTMVFFEAPHRLEATLKDIKAVLGDREIVLLKEMTKVFEEVIRGHIDEIIEHLAQQGVRGEYTVVVPGGKEKQETERLNQRALQRIDMLLLEGKMTLKDIANVVSVEEGASYRQVYKECLTRKNVTRNTHGMDKEV